MAIFAARQSKGLPHTARRCARAAGWLSVAIVLVLLVTAPVAAQVVLPPGMYLLDTVNIGGGLYEWRYRFVPGLSLPSGAYFEITGLYDVQASGFTSAQNWIITHTATTFRMTWGGPGSRPANCQNCPTAGTYFFYRSSSGTGAVVPWQRSDVPAENGTVLGAGEPTTLPASVSVYDNWIGFGALNPSQGSAAAPVEVIASRSPAGDWSPTVGIPAVGAYDVGYVQINAPVRLNLSVRMNGPLTRCGPAGQAFAGVDTRKQTPGPYELATQWKVAFHGKFLTLAGAPYASPTSGQVTAYDTWTGWSTGGNDPVADAGWLWPSTTDAWTGEAAAGYTTVTGLDLLVERSQYTDSATGGPAGICFIERVLRRGHQDVAGNYRQVIDVTLTYAE